MNKPRLIVREERRSGWDSLTQEQRRALTIPQLVNAMGSLHVHHPDYAKKAARGERLLPMQNLAGIQPVIERYDARLLGSWRRMLAWVMR